MKLSSNITSSIVPLPVNDIDTDQIIPARFLKTLSKEGLGKNLFADWRYKNDGSQYESFVLNQKKFSGEILLAGNNFGCGSSREHAAWAIKDYGFNVVISSKFADIFKNNAYNNFILPIEFPERIVENLFQGVFENPQMTIRINLEDSFIEFDHQQIEFSINAFKQHCLLNGLTEMAYLLNYKDKIELFEQQLLS